jgi:hypothetical protein
VQGSYRDQRIPDFEGLDPDIKPMSQDSFNAGFDYQIGPRSVVTIHYVHNDLNRTIEDIGSLVNGSEVYIYGNPGEGRAQEMFVTGLTAPFQTPRAKRQYDALEIGWERRFSNRWFASANYTLSRLWGNYSGLANTDEIRTPTLGVGYPDDQVQTSAIARRGGNEGRAWDLDELVWTDRPHVVKLFGSYSFQMGTTIGVFFYGGSGTPLSTVVNSRNGIQVLVNGRGDMGRTGVLTQTDLLVAHQFSMGSRAVRAELNVQNLFNQQTARHRYTSLNRGLSPRRTSAAANLANVDLAAGYDYNALIRASTEGEDAFDPRFNMNDLFNEGLRGEFLLKFTF